MMESVESLVNRLQSEKERTLTLFQALTESQWTRVIYTGPPAWTPRNFLAHFVSAEEQFLKLFKDIQVGGNGTPLGFFADEFNAEEQERFRDLSHGELLDLFSSNREEMIRWVKTLTAADLDKVGKHPVLGDLPLWEMIKALTLHSHLHERDLSRYFSQT